MVTCLTWYARYAFHKVRREFERKHDGKITRSSWKFKITDLISVGRADIRLATWSRDESLLVES